MSQYMTKVEYVEAWQYTALCTGIPMWAAPYLRVEEFRNQGHKLTVTSSVTDRRPNRSPNNGDYGVEMEAGNWIVKDSYGLWLYDAGTFRKRFDPVTNEPAK